MKVNNASDVDNFRNPVVRNVAKSKTSPDNTKNPFKDPHNSLMTNDYKIVSCMPRSCEIKNGSWEKN